MRCKAATRYRIGTGSMPRRRCRTCMRNRAGKRDKTFVRCWFVTRCRVGMISRNGSRCRHGMGYWVCKSCGAGIRSKTSS